MGRGFGRGAKSVAIVTRSQVGNKGKKTPKGLRGNRQKKRPKFLKNTDSQAELEQSLGVASAADQSKRTPRTLAQDIASIQFAHIVNKRQKGFKQLRRQIIQAAKNVRRRHAQKSKLRLAKERALEEQRAKRAAKKAASDKAD